MPDGVVLPPAFGIWLLVLGRGHDLLTPVMVRALGCRAIGGGREDEGSDVLALTNIHSV